MAGQTYQVNYIVNVEAQNAQTAINSFKRALSSMDKATKPLMDLQKKVRGLVETMSALNRGNYTVKINTKPATEKIGKLVRALQIAKSEVQQLNAMGVHLGNIGGKGKGGGTRITPTPAGRTHQRSTRTSKYATPKYAPIAKGPTNLGYKLWGPTPLPNNGGMAVDMLKGMGIAYGIAGMGTLISKVVDYSAEYDNLMKTVENILKSHDNDENFAGRFSAMTKMVRRVGMKTKFTVVEVADAARFLAMAGFNVDDIQQAISPIADIALVGDTDLGKTADLVTNIMTAYNISPSKMRNAADVMTNTFTMTNTTLTEIAESYKYAASLLSAGGIGFEEATAAIGVLGDAGIKSSQAGTTLRTIMANIVNPTKKQQAAWDAIGISRYDKNGNRKDLLQLFTELGNANLDVDVFYRLFHKTAASGAVALAAHADKWDKVYLENFLSTGMTRRLAEEKQNTFKGLTAQLESVFVDQGVTAFNGVQGHLRSLMKRAINWLDPNNKGSNAAEAFRRVSNGLMEFVQVLIDASKWFAWFFDNFGWFVKMWAKFQLMIWPIVKAVSAFRSVFLGLLGLKKVGTVILGVAGAFRSLSKATAAANATAVFSTKGQAATGAPISPWGFAAGMPWLPGLTRRQYARAAKGLNLLTPNFVQGYENPLPGQYGIQGAYYENKARTDRMIRDRKKFNKRVRRLQMYNGAKNLVKMGLGGTGVGVGMYQMTKENANGWDVLSGTAFSLAGAAAMAGGLPGLIAGGVLAVGGALVDRFFSWSTRLDALSDFVNNFAQKHQLLDGALLNGSTRTERYLEFVWRKNYDVNGLIQRRIELMKELIGIETPNETTTKDVGNETYKTMYERFYAADSIWGSSDAAERAAEIFNKYGGQYGLKIYKNKDKNWAYRDFNGVERVFANPKGSTDSNDVVMYDVAAAMELLHGPYRSKIIDENQHRLANMLYGKGTAADVRNWANTFAATYGPSSWANLIGPDQWTEDTDVAKFWTGEDVAKTLMGNQLLWASLYQIRRAQEAIANFKEKMAAGNLTENDVVSAIRWGDYDILGQTLADYNPNDISGWYRNLGYAGNGVWQDPSGRETPEVMAQTAAAQMERLLSSIKKLGLESDPATESLQTYANTMLTLAQSFLGQNEALSGSHDGEIKILNGQKWRWNATTKQWELVDDNNQPAQISQGLVSMSNNIQTLMTTLETANSQWPLLLPTFYNQQGNSWQYDGTSPFNWAQGGTSGPNSNAVLWNPLAQFSGGNNYSWFPSWNNGKNLLAGSTTYTTTGVTMAPQQMGNAIKSPSPTKTTSTNTATGTTDNGGRTGMASTDYKSHQKERAIPRQININIQNLMNVDSIDMTQPDNVAVVDRLKREVAYALYEAAADGTMMLNSLATQST